MTLPICSLIGTTIFAYFLGAIPFALVIGKAACGVDVREHGSGNTGATNVVRVLGWKVGIPVFLLDTFKGGVSCLIAAGVFGLVMKSAAAPALSADQFLMWRQGAVGLAFLASTLGHMYSPFLHFHGGKGVATTLGCALFAFPYAALVCLGIFIIIAVSTRLVSLASIIASLLVPVFVYVFYGPSIPFLVSSSIVALLIVFAHRKNIARLISGTEPKFSAGHNHVPQVYTEEEESEGVPSRRGSASQDDRK